MKAKIRESKKEFRPFELIIQVEDINDLKELWCRFNMPVSDVRASNFEYGKDITDFTFNNEVSVFNILDGKLGELKWNK